ncbi:MAG: hypothetical protein K2W78_08075 [Xanthobacteraceae bacterium]|nr:hypothetical protein [Xanthobacteraceae bacterium]
MITFFVIASSLAGVVLSYGAIRFPSHAKVLEVCAGALLLSAFIALGFCMR